MSKKSNEKGYVIGVDPGFGGGLCRIGFDGHVVDYRPMPIINGDKKHLDTQQINDFLTEEWADGSTPDLVAIEAVHAMPKQGVTSMFRFGEGFGMLQGICAALGVPYVLVRPQDWKKHVLKGYNQKDKSAAVQYVKRKYPSVNLLATPRSTKPHDGMADAICIAEYALDKHFGKEE